MPGGIEEPNGQLRLPPGQIWLSPTHLMDFEVNRRNISKKSKRKRLFSFFLAFIDFLIK